MILLLHGGLLLCDVDGGVKELVSAISFYSSGVWKKDVDTDGGKILCSRYLYGDFGTYA